jgi:hypothetical protein
MAQAIGSLSPKQIAERTQRHRQAVLILAHRRAKKALERELKAQGRRLTCIAPREINELAREYLTQHSERLKAEAEHAIATWPGFKQWRLPGANLTTNAQSESEPKSTISVVRMSGAQ